jgi:tetratricopeptide (TPR) repeat protein
MRISGRLLAVALLAVVVCGCYIPEVEKMKTASSIEESYRAWNELIEGLSRTPMIYQANPYYRPLGKGIRADWAGNYRQAEEAFRDAIENPAYWQTQYASPHRPMWTLTLRAYLANALFRQGKIEASIQNYSMTEPSFPSLINRCSPGSDDQKGWKVFSAYHCKYYGRALEKSEDIKRALEIYRKSFRYGASGVSAEITRLETMEASRAQGLKESLRQAERAKQNGQLREALGHYREALSMSAVLSGSKSIDPQIARKTIEVARRLDPPPAVPEDARRHAAFASISVKEAKDASGYEKAIGEYLRAVCSAPLWADLYVNAALVYEQMGRYQNAHDFLSCYLLAAPEAPDAAQIRTKLYELEFKAQQGKK